MRVAWIPHGRKDDIINGLVPMQDSLIAASLKDFSESSKCAFMHSSFSCRTMAIHPVLMVVQMCLTFTQFGWQQQQ